MKTDLDIQNDVINELNREAAMVASNVNVIVNTGNVILEGVADSYSKKVETERAALRLSAVKSVTNNIILQISNQKSDADIKKSLLKVITWNTCIDETKINIAVKDGLVTLSGTVEYDYQKSKAAILAEGIAGIKDVNNLIKVQAASPENNHRKLSA